MFKVNNKDIRMSLASLRLHWRCSGVIIVNFGRISHIYLVFLLLSFNKIIYAGFSLIHSANRVDCKGTYIYVAIYECVF